MAQGYEAVGVGVAGALAPACFLEMLTETGFVDTAFAGTTEALVPRRRKWKHCFKAEGEHNELRGNGLFV